MVARPEIKDAIGLRGKRVGVRVIGAGLWISAILALEQLGVDIQRDSVTMVPVGSPIQIYRALQEGAVDAALVSVEQSHELEAKGFQVLLRDYPQDIGSFEGGMVATSSYVEEHPSVVEAVVSALIEALAFCRSERNRTEVMEFLRTSLNVADAKAADKALSELRRKPYASLDLLRKMQRIISIHDPHVCPAGRY